MMIHPVFFLFWGGPLEARRALKLSRTIPGFTESRYDHLAQAGSSLDPCLKLSVRGVGFDPKSVSPR